MKIDGKMIAQAMMRRKKNMEDGADAEDEDMEAEDEGSMEGDPDYHMEEFHNAIHEHEHKKAYKHLKHMMKGMMKEHMARKEGEEGEYEENEKY